MPSRKLGNPGYREKGLQAEAIPVIHEQLRQYLRINCPSWSEEEITKEFESLAGDGNTMLFLSRLNKLDEEILQADPNWMRWCERQYQVTCDFDGSLDLALNNE